MADKMTSEKIRRLYKIPSGANYQHRSKNAIYISPSNSIRHEMAKALGAYQLRKYGDVFFNEKITETLKKLEELSKIAVKDCQTETTDFITEAVPKKEPERRVDLVSLKDNTRYEFETNKKTVKEGAITINI